MDQPNVLLICTDHWPGRMIGALGHPAVFTPTIDQMAALGIAFTNAYATTPTCIPARRELMTGTFSKTHGDRVFDGETPMPQPTIAQVFRDAGYHAYGVGKLHVNPPRDRIGFDDVLIHESGRLGNRDDQMAQDDYEHFLTERGYPGEESSYGIQNTFTYRDWHLPEYYHYTNWTAREMSRYIVRRDRDRPSFWYMSFDAPHPPFLPPAPFMDIYRGLEINESFMGDWARDFDALPFALKTKVNAYRELALSPTRAREIRRAFYAMSTHVDHQIKAVIGLLKEQGILDNTIMMFTSDHRNMQGDHGMFNQDVFYEGSANIPMVLMPTAEQAKGTGLNKRDGRLVAQADVMPTLLELCDIPIPNSVEGLSMVGDEKRDYLYGEFKENHNATRMVHDGRYKLIYYPVGNRFQIFDLREDPNELHDAADDPAYSDVRTRLTGLLKERIYGSDLEWLKDGELAGLPEPELTDDYFYNPTMGNARGYRWR